MPYDPDSAFEDAHEGFYPQPPEGEDDCYCGDEEEYDEEDGDGEEFDDSMDGDFDSGMSSAGFGTDEDYGYYGCDEVD